MTNTQIHTESSKYWTAAPRVGYFVRWYYDVTKVEGFKVGDVRWISDVTGVMSLANARRIAKRIAAANNEGFKNVRIERLRDSAKRAWFDETWCERVGVQLTDDEFFAYVDGYTHKPCCVCGCDTSTHPDAANPLDYCGDCGGATCPDHRESTIAALCTNCQAKHKVTEVTPTRTGVYDVRSMTGNDVTALIEANGGFLVREQYPFGVAPTYNFHLSDAMAVLFGGHLHVCPKAEKFPETVKAILRRDWIYLDRDRAWFMANIAE